MPHRDLPSHPGGPYHYPSGDILTRSEIEDLISDHNHTLENLDSALNGLVSVTDGAITGLAGVNPDDYLRWDGLSWVAGPLIEHTHDDRYYTEGEIDQILTGPAGSVLKGTDTGSAFGGLVADEIPATLNGTTFTGDVEVDRSSGTSFAFLRYTHVGTRRWNVGMDNNLGADLKIWRYNDDGTHAGTPLAIDRASGKVTLETTPYVGTTAVSLEGHLHGATAAGDIIYSPDGSTLAPFPLGAKDRVLASDGVNLSWFDLSTLGVTSIIAGTGISISPAGGQGDVTVTNAGITDITTPAGAGITLNKTGGVADLQVNWSDGYPTLDERYAQLSGATFTGNVRFSENVSGLIYSPLEGTTYALRFFLMFDYTTDASYPYLTNRTPNGAVVIKTGTALGGAENEHFRIAGGDGVVAATFTNVNLSVDGTAVSLEGHNHTLENLDSALAGLVSVKGGAITGVAGTNQDDYLRWDTTAGDWIVGPLGDHTHDDRYYTEGEIDTILTGASGSVLKGTDTGSAFGGLVAGDIPDTLNGTTFTGAVSVNGASASIIDKASAHMGLVLENADARAGIELETQSATAAGEGILNLGINTGRHITSKGTSPTGMWFRQDTRGGYLGWRWMYRAAGGSTITTPMILTEDGNLGLGTTDIEAWTGPAIQLGTVSAFAALPNLNILQNAYWDGAWKYRTTDAATRLSFTGGTFGVSVAPSGDIDTTLTWKTALTINNNGSLTLNNPLSAANGGTGLGANYAAGDIIYALGASDLTTLPVGSNPDGYVLTLFGGEPAWMAPSGTSGFSGTRTWVSGSDEHTVQVTDGVIDSWTVGPAPA